MNPKSLSLVALAAVLFLPPISSRAQIGGGVNRNWKTVACGGGTSTGGSFSVSGTIGQSGAGLVAGGSFKLEGGFWNGLQVTQTVGAPVLKIKFVGTNAVLSWPIGVTGYTLEDATSIASPAWTPTPQSIIDTVTEHTVTVLADGVIKVFRLKK